MATTSTSEAPLCCRRTEPDLWEVELEKIKHQYRSHALKFNLHKQWRELDSLCDEFSPCPPSKHGQSVRLMQWNVLADGLSHDGFFVNPVLDDWPVALNKFPRGNQGDKDTTSDGELIGDFISKMQGVTKACEEEQRAEIDKKITSLNLQYASDRYQVAHHHYGKFIPRHSVSESIKIASGLSAAELEVRIAHDAVQSGLCIGSIAKRISLTVPKHPPSPPGLNSSAMPPPPPPSALHLSYSTASYVQDFGDVSDEEIVIRVALHLQKIFRGKRARRDTKVKKKWIKEKVARLKVIQKEFATPHLTRNSSAVIDWESRWCRLRYQIIKAKPDILTMTEVDKLPQMQTDLASLGYDCGFPGKTYRPMHATRDKSMSFLDFLQQSGIAYAPNFLSNALAIGIGNMVDSKTLAAASEKMMGGHPFEKEWSARSLFKDKKFLGNGGTQRLFQLMRDIDPAVPDAGAFDDDCSVIFWRRDRFSLAQIHYLDMSAKGKCKSAVRAELIDRSTGKRVQVMTAHLASGTAAKDNKKRMKELGGTHCVEGAHMAAATGTTDTAATSTGAKDVQRRSVRGVLGWFEDSCKAGRCILAMDANSRPQFKAKTTVWKAFALASVEERAGGEVAVAGADSAVAASSRKWRSVWDPYFDETGEPRKGTGKGSSPSSPVDLDPPVTVNKMRGTQSEQPKKIGIHAYELIDHVWYSRGVECLKHVVAPKQYVSVDAAKELLIPDLVFPTDHMPVVVDMELV